MISLGLLEILDSLRWVEDDEVFIQCHVFDTSKHADDEHEESLGRKSTANHYDLFESVFEKVKDTPLSFSFLVLLQNLDRLDPKDHESDEAWVTLEEISGRLAISPKNAYGKSLSDASTQTMSENDNDAESVLSEDSGRPISRSESMNSHASVENAMESNSQNNLRLKKKTCLTLLKFFASSHLNQESPEIGERPSSPLQNTAVPSGQTVSSIHPPPPPPPLPSSYDVPVLPVSCPELGMAPPPPPPPPPPPVFGTCPPPPPPPPPVFGTCPPPPPPPPPVFGTCPPPPPLPVDPGGNTSTNKSASSRPLPPYLQPGSYHTFPKPKQKMKTLNWSKIPVALVSGKSIWSELCQDTENVRLNFEQVEELFCQKSAVLNTDAVPKGKLKREQSEVSLLDPKRSLNVNIFLKQFKGGGKELVELIRNCRSGEIGVERLRTLMKVLPQCDEVTLIKDFTGDKMKLGTAEKFYSLLSEVKAYKVRVQGMIQVEELHPNVESLRPQIQQYLETCEILLNSAPLKQFLKLVLVTGNFINAGSYAGNALGFRLNTLPKLMETRANKPRMTLLHYLVDVAEKENKEMLNFTEELHYISQCAKLTVDGLSGEVKQLVSGIRELEKQIDDSDTNLREFFGSFIKDAKIQLGELEKGIEEIKSFSSRLAVRFCEDEKRFKIEDCINSFHIFCEKIKIAKRENEERKRQEERAERLRKQREEEQMRKGHNTDLKEEETLAGEQRRRKGRRGGRNSSWSAKEELLIDMLLSDIKKGDFQSCKTKCLSNQHKI